MLHLKARVSRLEARAQHLGARFFHLGARDDYVLEARRCYI